MEIQRWRILKITDINEWLIDNKNQYQNIKSQKFPPLNNEFYWNYNRLLEFIKYLPFNENCKNALKALKSVLNKNFLSIINWVNTYEKLGSELLMFEVYYINWSEKVIEPLLKIHEGLYTERWHFADIICFCKLFQLLYWGNNIQESNLTEKEQLAICTNLQNILDDYYRDLCYPDLATSNN